MPGQRSLFLGLPLHSSSSALSLDSCPLSEELLFGVGGFTWCLLYLKSEHSYGQLAQTTRLLCALLSSFKIEKPENNSCLWLCIPKTEMHLGYVFHVLFVEILSGFLLGRGSTFAPPLAMACPPSTPYVRPLPPFLQNTERNPAFACLLVYIRGHFYHVDISLPFWQQTVGNVFNRQCFVTICLLTNEVESDRFCWYTFALVSGEKNNKEKGLFYLL